MSDRFFYVTYIRAPQEGVFRALLEPEFTRRYWSGTHQECDWKVGSPWKLMIPDGRVADFGTVLAYDPPRRFMLEWRNHFLPELEAEGPSRLTVELETLGDAVRVTLVHEIDRDNSRLIAGVAQGWPMILSGLKTLLETGETFAGADKWPAG